MPSVEYAYNLEKYLRINKWSKITTLKYTALKVIEWFNKNKSDVNRVLRPQDLHPTDILILQLSSITIKTSNIFWKMCFEDVSLAQPLTKTCYVSFHL